MIATYLKTFRESRRTQWIVGIVTAVIALYGALGFWVAPGIVRDQLIKQLSAALDRPVTLAEVRINPYALSATLTGFAVTERDGRLMMAFDELYANLSATSLLRWAWSLSEFRLIRPRVELVLDKGGNLNLAALGPATPTPPVPDEPSALPRLIVSELAVTDGQIGFEDQRHPQVAPRRAERVSFALKDFSTLPDESGAHTFVAVTDAGTMLNWRGTIGVNPLQSAGQVALTGVQVAQLAPYAVSAPTQLLGGTVDVQADYTLRVAPESSEFAVSAGRFVLNDVRAREGRAELTPLNLELAPVALRWQRPAAPADGAAQVALELVPNGSGRVAIQGALGTNPFSADLSMTLDDVALAPFQTFLEPYARAGLKRGRLDASGRLAVGAGESPEVRFAGGAVLRDVAALDSRTQQEFARWRRLAFDKIRFASRPAMLEINSIDAEEPYLRFIIGPDRITNLQHILEVDTEPAAKPALPPAGGAPDFRTRISSITVRNGSANFADQSLKPNFATGIQQLNGKVQGLSSDPKARAKVALRGKVDRYAPALIDGDINPLAAEAFTDLTLKFENIELTTFTPYSGKFAGFRIDKGKLSLDLRYQLQDRSLNGENRIVLNQLTLGERVESPDALELPIRLAVAILQDSRGMIELDLPVSGDIEDPEFSYGSLIGKAIVNLILKAITAPFTLLAGAFGGGEELGFITFAPGGAELAPTERDKLEKLSRGLADRPGLKLDIRGAASPEADRRAIASATLDRKIRRDPALPADAPLSGAERRRLLALYENTFGPEPPPVDERVSEPEREARLLEAARARLIASQPVTEEELRALARARASVIVDELVRQSAGVQQRVFITDVDTATPASADGVRVELKLGAS